MTTNCARAAAAAFLSWSCAGALAAAPSGPAIHAGPAGTHQLIAEANPADFALPTFDHDKDAGSADADSQSSPLLTGSRICMLLGGLGALGLLTRRRGM